MSEITKLYENAGIEPERQDCCKIADKYWANETESGFEYLMLKECPYNQECTDECEYAYDKIIYPPFTAEKQIELIKWLASSRKGILISDMGEGEFSEFNISTGFYYCAKHIQDFRKNKDLSVVIAEFINHLWQSLTPEEKQQVKGILE